MLNFAYMSNEPADSRGSRSSRDSRSSRNSRSCMDSSYSRSSRDSRDFKCPPPKKKKKKMGGHPTDFFYVGDITIDHTGKPYTGAQLYGYNPVNMRWRTKKWGHHDTGQTISSSYSSQAVNSLCETIIRDALCKPQREDISLT